MNLSDIAARLQGKKAQFVILEGENKEREIDLQFNPSGYSVEESNEFSEKKLMGLKGVVHQFTGSKKADLSLELMFDGTEKGVDVRELIAPLKQIFEIDSTLHAPPPCRFIWGGFTFDGFVTTHKKEFTYFYHDGTPGRVKLSVTLKPYTRIDETVTALSLESSDITKQRVLVEGDTLFDMAYREYRDPAAWRRIAEYNGIDDPLNVPAGSSLGLPSKDKNG